MLVYKLLVHYIRQREKTIISRLPVMFNKYVSKACE